jgi:Flp pilus assembly protein TadD
MVHLVDLEKAYPNDARLLSMKGTLWMKLGRPELARQSWEQVLQIDPDNRPVLDALRTLNQGGERP